MTLSRVVEANQKSVRLPVRHADYIGADNAKLPGSPAVSVFEKRAKDDSWGVLCFTLRQDGSGCLIPTRSITKAFDWHLPEALSQPMSLQIAVPRTACGSISSFTESIGRTLSAKFIRTGVKAIYVDAGRDLMVCEQRDREMSSYGPEKFVWTTEIYAMKLSQNKLWPVVTGLVDAQRPVIRPKE